MHPLNKFFDHVFVLSLVDRYERRSTIKERLDNLGIDFEFYDAVEYGWCLQILKLMHKNGNYRFEKPNEIGVAMNHYAMIKIAKERKYKNVLIIEDDMKFLKNLNDIIENYIERIPDDYDMIYFSSSTWNDTEWVVDGYIKRTHDSFGAFFYGINSKFYDTILNEMNNVFQIIDVLYKNLQKNITNKIYHCVPNLASHMMCESVIQGKITNYWSPYISSYYGKTPDDYI